jgi:hypothetical protein
MQNDSLFCVLRQAEISYKNSEHTLKAYASIAHMLLRSSRIDVIVYYKKGGDS